MTSAHCRIEARIRLYGTTLKHLEIRPSLAERSICKKFDMSFGLHGLHSFSHLTTVVVCQQ